MAGTTATGKTTFLSLNYIPRHSATGNLRGESHEPAWGGRVAAVAAPAQEDRVPLPGRLSPSLTWRIRETRSRTDRGPPPSVWGAPNLEARRFRLRYPLRRGAPTITARLLRADPPPVGVRLLGRL